MEIKNATKEDVEGILALQNQIYRIDKLPENAAEILEGLIGSTYCQILVAKENNTVLGSCFLYILPVPAHGKPFAFLEGTVVDKNHRGQGIGSKLTEKAIEVARQKNAYKIIFTSGFDREDIHKFYEKLGLKKWGYEFRMDLE